MVVAHALSPLPRGKGVAGRGAAPWTEFRQTRVYLSCTDSLGSNTSHKRIQNKHRHSSTPHLMQSKLMQRVVVAGNAPERPRTRMPSQALSPAPANSGSCPWCTRGSRRESGNSLKLSMDLLRLHRLRTQEVEGTSSSGEEGPVLSGADTPRQEDGATQNEQSPDSSLEKARGKEEKSGAVEGALAVLKFYKREISPWLPGSCRYVPTCSEYAMAAFQRYGFWKGCVLTGWRLMRCNPLGGTGFDPPRWFGEPRPPSY